MLDAISARYLRAYRYFNAAYHRIDAAMTAPPAISSMRDTFP